MTLPTGSAHPDPTPAPTSLPPALDRVDSAIARFMRLYGVRAMRWALAFIFILFGILKPLGVSPAEQLVLNTVEWVPLVGARTMLNLIGWWEVAIGLCLAIRPLVRLGILLMALQMVGTFMPLVMLPSACYVRKPALGGAFEMWTLTTEAQYILKNLLIIAGALIIGGTVRRPAETGEQYL